MGARVAGQPVALLPRLFPPAAAARQTRQSEWRFADSPIRVIIPTLKKTSFVMPAMYGRYRANKTQWHDQHNREGYRPALIERGKNHKHNEDRQHNKAGKL